MPRIARVCAEGYPHHITQRGNNKEKVFFDNADKRFYLDVLKQYKNKYSMKVLAYCLMGTHVHVLAVPERETSLARGMGGTNLLYTQHINRKYGRSGRLWQNRFFSTQRRVVGLRGRSNMGSVPMFQFLASYEKSKRASIEQPYLRIGKFTP